MSPRRPPGRVPVAGRKISRPAAAFCDSLRRIRLRCHGETMEQCLDGKCKVRGISTSKIISGKPLETCGWIPHFPYIPKKASTPRIAPRLAVLNWLFAGYPVGVLENLDRETKGALKIGVVPGLVIDALWAYTQRATASRQVKRTVLSPIRVVRVRQRQKNFQADCLVSRRPGKGLGAARPVRKNHDNRNSEVLQFRQGFWLYRTGRRRQGCVRSCVSR